MNIQIDKNEVLRYLGHKGQVVDDTTALMIKECATRIQKISRPRFVYKIFDIKNNSSNNTVDVLGTELKFVGNDICNHLSDCKKCAIMAMTLGVEVDNEIRVAQATDMLRAIVLDSCATDYIEKFCDEAQKEIEDEAKKCGKGTTFRFSPGYGDLPIESQKLLLDVLDASRKIGLTLTNSKMMVPCKSVTAIIGFTDAKKKVEQKSKCDICSLRENCMFRKGGITCERGRIYKA